MTEPSNKLTCLQERKSRRSLRSLHREQSRVTTLHMNPGAKVTPVGTLVEENEENNSNSQLVTNVEETDM